MCFFWLFLTGVPSVDASAADASRVTYSNPVANQLPFAPSGFQKFGRIRVQPRTRGRKTRACKRKVEDLRDIVVAREPGLFSSCVRKAAERQLGSQNSREKLRNWQLLLRRPFPSLYDWYAKKARGESCGRCVAPLDLHGLANSHFCLSMRTLSL